MAGIRANVFFIMPQEAIKGVMFNENVLRTSTAFHNLGEKVTLDCCSLGFADVNLRGLHAKANNCHAARN